MDIGPILPQSLEPQYLPRCNSVPSIFGYFPLAPQRDAVKAVLLKRLIPALHEPTRPSDAVTTASSRMPTKNKSGQTWLHRQFSGFP
jgi:hypothetical protein